IEMAHAWIIDQAVLEPVDRVARGNGRLGDQRELGGGNDVRAIGGVRRSPCPEITSDLANSIVARIAGDDAVVVFRKTLRPGKRLMSAGRTTHKVRVVRKSSGMIANDQLRHFRSHVYGAV